MARALPGSGQLPLRKIGEPTVTDRSATATIKGYFYQFDQTIVRLLEATSETTPT